MVTDEMIEEAARNIVRANGAAIIANDENWPSEVAHYREMCAKYPNSVEIRSLIHDAFRNARAALEAALSLPKAEGEPEIAADDFNAGLKGAAQIASEQVASTRNVRIRSALASPPAPQSPELTRTELQEARDWQPMETAPRDRWLLLDMSYVYEGDTDPTEVYVVGQWVDSTDGYCWDCGEEVFHQDAVRGWVEVPKSGLLRPAPAKGDGG